MKLQGVIYHEGVHPNCGHYTAAVNINNSWFTVSDSDVANQVKLPCTYVDTTVPYILMYKKCQSLHQNPAQSSITKVRSKINETDYRFRCIFSNVYSICLLFGIQLEVQFLRPGTFLLLKNRNIKVAKIRVKLFYLSQFDVSKNENVMSGSLIS